MVRSDIPIGLSGSTLQIRTIEMHEIEHEGLHRRFRVGVLDELKGGTPVFVRHDEFAIEDRGLAWKRAHGVGDGRETRAHVVLGA